MNFTFRCKHVPIKDGVFSKEPILPITLTGRSGVVLNFNAVLDSGSDFVLLPLEVAEELDLDFDKSNPESAKVYTGETITTTFSRVVINQKRQGTVFIQLPLCNSVGWEKIT